MLTCNDITRQYPHFVVHKMFARFWRHDRSFKKLGVTGRACHVTKCTVTGYVQICRTNIDSQGLDDSVGRICHIFYAGPFASPFNTEGPAPHNVKVMAPHKWAESGGMPTKMGRRQALQGMRHSFQNSWKTTMPPPCLTTAGREKNPPEEHNPTEEQVGSGTRATASESEDRKQSALLRTGGNCQCVEKHCSGVHVGWALLCGYVIAS
eukprot:jgi/Botrbrau1/7438/Bobra.0083s0011.1